MAGGLAGLLDDVAALAKLAAASIDDVGAAAGKASMKAAGVVVDDAAVTPGYVQGLAAERELPIIRRIATGSVRNKLLFILPVALLLSAVAPKLVEVILMCGGAYLAYEGVHKIWHKMKGDDHGHDVPAVLQGKDVEEARAILAFTTRDAAKAWSKLLESAVANAEHNHELVGEDLRILSVHADEGPTLKRYRPRAMGRATRIRKRTSHLSITLTPKES